MIEEIPFAFERDGSSAVSPARSGHAHPPANAAYRPRGVRVVMAPIVLDDDSDDDVPLFARPRPPIAKKDESSSSEPEWMNTFKSPVQKIVDDLSSDDDVPSAAAMRTAGTAATPKPVEPTKATTPQKTTIKSPPALAEEDADDDDDDDDVKGEKEVKAEETKPATTATATTAATAKPAKMPGAMGAPTPDRIGEIPLLMPATVNRNKIFFECEGAGESVDLEGDVGVVGRLLSDPSAKYTSGVKVDLKGVIYDAKILPTPASIVVLAVNQTEAKVECIANDYVQLRRDVTANNVGGTLEGYLGVDSDDDDQHERGRAAAGNMAAAAVRGMDDVSDDDEFGGGGGGKKRKGAPAAQKLGADGKKKKTAGGGAGRKPAKKAKKAKAKGGRGKKK